MRQLTACAYARYSSDRQQESSITVQLAHIRKFCEEHNINLIHEYVDEAQTGTVATRKNFQKMIDDARLGEFNLVLVHRMDRWARNVDDARHYKKYLRRYGIRIVSVIESFDETPEGEFFELMSMGMAELYSKKLARECLAGMLANAREGKAQGGMPPLGYKRDGKYYAIDEQEAEAVRLMFDLTAKGYSYKYIADYLNENGYHRADGRKFTWHLYEILRNRKYIGEYIFNRAIARNPEMKRNSHKSKDESEIIRIPNGMPRIIDDETFYKVQSILDDRQDHKQAKRTTDSKYLLSGLLQCKKCNHSYCGNPSFSHNKRGTAYKYGGGKEGCNSRPITVAYLDDYILNLLTNCLLCAINHNNTVELTKICYIAAHDKIDSDISVINKKIDSINGTIAEYVDEITHTADNKMSKYLSQELMNMQNAIQRLSDQIYLLQEQKSHFPPFNPKVIKHNAIKFDSKLNSPNFEDKKATLNKLIKVILIDNDTVEVTINMHEFLSSSNPIYCTIIERRNNIALSGKHDELTYRFSNLVVAV